MPALLHQSYGQRRSARHCNLRSREKSLKENDEDNYKNQITEEEKEPIVETVVISGIRSDHFLLPVD